MKSSLLALALLAFATNLFSQTTDDDAPPEAVEKPAFDPALAEKLGADDYGMHRYTLALLKTGPAQIDNKRVTDSLFMGHFANMERLVGEGKLVLAGPIGKKEKYRGLFILDTPSADEARRLCATDPAIASGLLEPEFLPYYGSAALKMVNDWHGRIQKTGISEAAKPAPSSPAGKPDPKAAMARATAADDAIGKKRNHACESAPLSEAIKNYAADLAALPMDGCPAAFAAAYQKHRAAWLELLPMTDRHAALRGEMHDLFKILENGPDGAAFKAGVKKVWDTWAEVEAAMK